MVDIIVPKPSVVERYHKACSTIDKHNRCRQDDLKLERKLGTKRWDFRLNCSILGVIIVDAWLMHSGIRGEQSKLSQRQFYEELATLLIKRNHVDNVQQLQQNLNTTPRSSTGIHLILSGKKRPNSGRAQRRCRVCKRKISNICSNCAGPYNEGEWFCNATTGRDCFEQHLRKSHNWQST